VKYSDNLPKFSKGHRSSRPDKGQERFQFWIDEARTWSNQAQARPMMRMVALLVIIIGLGFGVQHPSGVMARLKRKVHVRSPIPVGISAGDPPVFDEANLTQAVKAVQPVARKCLEGWEGMRTNEDGMVVAEIVLTPSGPDEAALYDQDGIPNAVQNCLASALATVAWPLPDERRAIPFPLLGGKKVD
jgi:hypothetical protein